MTQQFLGWLILTGVLLIGTAFGFIMGYRFGKEDKDTPKKEPEIFWGD